MDEDHRRYGTAASIILLVVFVILLAFLAWVSWHIYQRFRARRLGLPPPTLNPFASNNRIPSRNFPAPSGPLGWIRAKFDGLRNGRMARGAYEGTSARPAGSRAGRRGFGALDPDEAWDTRVGNEADEYGPGYEEQELGLTAPRDGGRPGHGYGPSGGLEEIVGDRGRSRGRTELDDRYDEEMGGSVAAPSDPFGDTAERSNLRGVSPRPHVEPDHTKGHKKGKGSREDSPTERKSMFTENV